MGSRLLWHFLYSQLMRFAFLFATLFFGIHLGANALATVSEHQEQRAEQFCKVNPDFC